MACTDCRHFDRIGNSCNGGGHGVTSDGLVGMTGMPIALKDIQRFVGPRVFLREVRVVASTALEPISTAAFFDDFPHACLLVDPEGCVLAANSASAWIGRHLEGVEFSDLAGVFWAAEGNGGDPLPHQWMRRLRVAAADGGSRPVDVSVFAAGQADASVPPGSSYVILQDATHALQAARARQDGELRSKISADSAPVLLWMAGSDAHCDWFSNAWLKFRGRSLGDELGDGWLDGVHPEDKERCLGVYAASFDAREAFTIDFRLRRHDGEYRWVMSTGIPRHADDGRFVGFVGSCHDVTERKALEDTLAERTRSLRLADRRREEFLGRLSHRLRDPLAPIANAVQLLRRIGRHDEALQMPCGIIERQVARLDGLIIDMLDITRLMKGKAVLQCEPTPVAALIDTAVGNVEQRARRRHQTVRVTLVAVPATMRCDRHRAAQAIEALLDNAVRFSPDGAVIEVAVRVDDAQLKVLVCDSGCGIGAELLPHVFEPFVQGKQPAQGAEPGWGVGLTLVRSVARLHGGDARIVSAGAGQGTLAELWLPLAGPAGRADLGGDLGDVNGQRVLLIDDNVDYLQSLRALVEANGADVRTACDAKQALGVVEEFKPDLIVCDIDMPGMDGYALAQQLRTTLQDEATRIIAVTGRAQVEDRERALDSGFDAFAIKPIRAHFMHAA